MSRVLHLFLLPDDIKLPIDNNGAQAASSESMVTEIVHGSGDALADLSLKLTLT
jgi:hypothetical protein